MSKVRRPQDAHKYVLCEEVSLSGSTDKDRGGDGRSERRIMSDDENVHLTQLIWKSSMRVSRFVLVERNKAMEVLSQRTNSFYTCVIMILDL